MGEYTDAESGFVYLRAEALCLHPCTAFQTDTGRAKVSARPKSSKSKSTPSHQPTHTERTVQCLPSQAWCRNGMAAIAQTPDRMSREQGLTNTTCDIASVAVFLRTRAATPTTLSARAVSPIAHSVIDDGNTGSRMQPCRRRALPGMVCGG